MKISELLKFLGSYEIAGHLGYYEIKETEITALHHDSREAAHGSMFFCLEGTRVSGAKFAVEAVKNGALCLVAEKWLEDIPVVQIIVPNVREAMSLIAKAFYGNKVDEMRIVGVVGTNGKTTCTHILRHILEVASEKVGVIGTLGIWFGKRRVGFGLTTPDPIHLHRIFAQMHDDGIHIVVMEASAHAIHFKKLAGIAFEIVIFTNLTQDHLDFFGTFENYSNTKIGFFLTNSIRTAVINTDNEFGRRILNERKGKSVEYALRDVKLFPNKSIIDNEFEVNLPARFNAENTLGCVTAAKMLGVIPEKIKEAVRTIPRITGRFNVFNVAGTTVVIDYAHTPDGLEKIISAVREFAPKKIITVFGCGGNRDKAKRQIMGKIAARLSDFTVVTSDNPRFERPSSIMKQIRKGFKIGKNKNFVMIVDRETAIKFALGKAQVDDIIIIAGKGGETHTEIKGKLIEYTDESVITTHIKQSLGIDVKPGKCAVSALIEQCTDPKKGV